MSRELGEDLTELLLSNRELFVLTYTELMADGELPVDVVEWMISELCEG